jgi:hypothetical protein
MGRCGVHICASAGNMHLATLWNNTTVAVSAVSSDSEGVKRVIHAATLQTVLAKAAHHSVVTVKSEQVLACNHDLFESCQSNLQSRARESKMSAHLQSSCLHLQQAPCRCKSCCCGQHAVVSYCRT